MKEGIFWFGLNAIMCAINIHDGRYGLATLSGIVALAVLAALIKIHRVRA